MCPYASYGYIDGYDREIILCSKSNESCPFTRYCNKVNKIIPNDRSGYRMEDCRLSKLKDIPKDSYRIRFERKGFLYIEKDNQVIKVKNTLKDKVEDYVYMKEDIDGTYLISTEPFKAEIKTSYNRKKLSES